MSDGEGELLRTIPLVRQLDELSLTLIRAAYLDSLTHVFTRNALAAITATKGDLAYGAAYFDLNGFKALNDRHGHEAGDAALEFFGSLLLAIQRNTPSFVPFRMGGDEFLALVGPSEPASITEALASLVQNSFEFEGHAITIGASVGYAVPDADSTPDTVIERAELAARVAKTRRMLEPVCWSPDLKLDDILEFRQRCSPCELNVVLQVARRHHTASCLSVCPNCGQTFDEKQR